MPLRVANSVEKNVSSIGQVPIVIPANKSVTVLNDLSLAPPNSEYSGRYIQNVGAGIAYYAIGHDCDATNFSGVLFAAGAVDANGFGSGQQLDCSNCSDEICIYSVAGTTIAVTLLSRNDMASGRGGILRAGSPI